MNETQTLPAVWSKKTVQDDLAGSTRNKKVLLDIAGKLEGMGIRRTFVECREKIKKLRQQYKTPKKYNNTSRADGKTFRWFNRMDAVLGEKPSTNEGRRIH